MQAVSTARPKSSTSGLTPDWAAVTARKAAILRLGDLAFEIVGAFHLSAAAVALATTGHRITRQC
ncbi:hypothetical protein NKI63_16130 [Mesorhizobium sp. M0410]|uniref:hypothetical protein n=1 Tax=Mesorhizobium sp. M0410 TaxID=2956943 RepID=UPI00333BDABE